MIIECINCNKVFEVNSELIPENGRTIQCGSCNHVWFYNPKIADIKKEIKQDVEIDVKEKPTISQTKKNEAKTFKEESYSKLKDKKNSYALSQLNGVFDDTKFVNEIIFEYFFKQVKNMNKKEFKEFLKIVNIDYETL